MSTTRDEKRLERIEEACYGELSPDKRFRLSAEALTKDEIENFLRQHKL
jgi:hypothetical protein